MFLVDNGITDLAEGYARIRTAESEILSRWRYRLLEAYAQRRDIYEAELAEYRRRSAEFIRRFRIGIWLSSALLILGIIILPAVLLIGELGSLRGPLLCFAPLLILGGLNGWAILGMMWFWQRDRVKPSPPLHPLKISLTSEILPLWMGGLRGQLPEKKGEDTSSGDIHLLARLQNLISESYILYHLKTALEEEVDLMIVGPKGVWVFELKHLNGVIRWQNGVWTQRNVYHRYSKPRLEIVIGGDQAYDRLWQKKVDRVSAIIQNDAPDLVSKLPNITRVRGGLVFTHPRAKYEIPLNSPFNWGVIPFWLEKLSQVREIPGLDEKAIIKILDVLINNHQQYKTIKDPRSMLGYAEDLIDQAEKRLEAWVEQGK